MATKQLRISLRFRDLLILIIFFVVGYLSAKDGLRATRYPVVNAVDYYILPYPSRAAYFEQFGMPERTSPTYQPWADENLSKAYALFLASHPGFIVSTLRDYAEHFAFDFIQPYYTWEMPNRSLYLMVGQFVHPQTLAVFLIDALLLLALLLRALQHRRAIDVNWAWLAAWFLLIAFATMLISFFGDVYGTRRHIMPSVEISRLFLWVFLLPILDIFISERT
jgi:hypothetical protein